MYSRSEKERLRPRGREAEGAKCVGGIPPELRNQRLPTGADTPASIPASSLERPTAIPSQNRHRVSRCQTGGRHGEHNLRRVDRSDFRFPAIVYASNVKVLR